MEGEGGRERESCQPTEWELDKHDMQLIETYLVTAEWEHHTTAHKVEERTNETKNSEHPRYTGHARKRPIHVPLKESNGLTILG